MEIRGVSSFFLFNLAKKYSLINRTEKRLNGGKFDEALELSINSYEKEQNRKLGWFFVFTKLNGQTDFDKKKLFSKYKATINYGYCLKSILNGTDGEEIFNEALLISKSPLLIEDQNNLMLTPTLFHAELNLKKQKLKVADDYFKDYYNLILDSGSEDVEKVISTYFLFIDQAIRVGI